MSSGDQNLNPDCLKV